MAYIYALLDPRKPGPFSYNDLAIFDYEPFYIGKGTKNRHRDFRTRTRWCKGIIKHLKTIGLKPLSFIIQDNLSDEQAFTLEREWIQIIGKRYEGTGPLVNTDDGGRGCSGHTDETKQRISDANSGRIFTEEHRHKISEALQGKNNPMYGKPGPRKGAKHTQNAKDAISHKNRQYYKTHVHPWKGKSHTEESKEKISKSKTGTKLNPEHVEKLRAAMTGKTHSEDTKRRMAKSHEVFHYLITHPDGHTETVTNLREFCQRHNLNQGNMCKVLNHIAGYHQHKGFVGHKIPTTK